MDHLDLVGLKQLARHNGGIHISVYAPMIQAGDQTQQNRIRLKNQLQQAERRLEETDTPDVWKKGLLEPAHALTQDREFLRTQDRGLALFLAEDELETIRVPYEVPELSVLGVRYHLKPLIPMASDPGMYYVLALDQEGVRLFQGTHYSFEQLPLRGAPNRLSEFLRWDDPEAQMQWHTQTGRLDVSAGGRESIFHGHGAGAEGEAATQNLLRFLRALNRAVYEMLAGDRHPPLVLHGGKRLLGHYRKVNSYPNMLEEAEATVPHRLTATEVRQHTRPLLEEYLTKAQREARVRFLQASDDMRSSDLETCLIAAHDGRVRALFVPVDRQVWGRYDATRRTVTLDQRPTARNLDLLDLAAVQALESGAEVCAVQGEEMPGTGLLAAVFRFPQS